MLYIEGVNWGCDFEGVNWGCYFKGVNWGCYFEGVNLRVWFYQLDEPYSKSLYGVIGSSGLEKPAF